MSAAGCSIVPAFIEALEWKDVGRDDTMRIQYDAEADVLLLLLRDDAPVDAIEEPGSAT